MKFAKTKEVLNQLVADLSQGAAAIHQIHWYMRGAGFLTLHPKMDDYMDELNDVLDEVSERLITLDGAPYSTLEEYIKHTGIKSVEASYNKSMEENVGRVLDIFRYLNSVYDKGIAASAEEGDDVTNDILIAAKTSTEKNIWMLAAALNKAPELDK